MMKRKDRFFRVLASAVFAIGLAGLSSCEQYSWTPPEPPVIDEDIIISFEQHILPKCSGCHTWTRTKIYNELVSEVDTVNPEDSHIFVIHANVNNFNTPVQINDTVTYYFNDVIKLWASQGAKDNKK
jgi:hypothetical protein